MIDHRSLSSHHLVVDVYSAITLNINNFTVRRTLSIGIWVMSVGGIEQEPYLLKIALSVGRAAVLMPG